MIGEEDSWTSVTSDEMVDKEIGDGRRFVVFDGESFEPIGVVVNEYDEITLSVWIVADGTCYVYCAGVERFNDGVRRLEMTSV